MSVLGPVTPLDRALLRPPDRERSTAPPAWGGGHAGTVERVVRVGFEVRVFVALGRRDVVEVTMTRTHFGALGVGVGDPVWVGVAAGAPVVAAASA
jgi:hypothetical protein